MFDALITHELRPVSINHLTDLDAASLRFAAPEAALEAEAWVSATAKRLRHNLLEVEA